MKKGLLLGSMLLMGASAFAATEGATYENVNGMTLTNISINNANVGSWRTLDGTVIPAMGRQRTGTVLGDKVYCTCSSMFGTDGAAVDGAGLLIIFDLYTGECLKSVALNVDGAEFPVKLLGANNISVDHYGHIFITNFVGTMFNSNDETGEVTPNPFQLYWLKDPETGTCTKIHDFTLSEDSEAYNGRVDYVSVGGDITREEAPCVVMTTLNGSFAAVAGWYCDLNSDEWIGHMNGMTADVAEFAEDCFYPTIAAFSSTGTVTILRDENNEYQNMYVDDFNSAPTLLTADGSCLYNFSTATEGLVPVNGPTGCNEFYMGDDIYFVYPINDYDKGAYSNIIKLSENGDFDGAELYYTFPQNGMSDGVYGQGVGPRIQVYDINVVTDDNGKNGAYIFTYKAMNGFAYYLFAEEGFQGAGVEGVEAADPNAPVEYFNLQGVRVANPENGIFVRRQGANVTKVVL